jgi:hypothetical protein
LFPEFKESHSWDATAVQRLTRQVREGYFQDGCHRERVWGYGWGTLRNLTDAHKFADRHGGLGEDDQEFREGLRRAYRFYAKTLGPRYLQPSFGDCGRPRSAQNILEKGQELFPEDTGLDLGVDRAASHFLPESGFAVMRSGDQPDSSYVNVNFGRFAGWHSHQDLLSMNFWSQGVPLLEETGRFGPYASPLDTWFRSPDAHNLVLIDGMVYDCRHAEGDQVAWESNGNVDYFSACHRAYRYHVYGPETEISNNIDALVRRTIVLVKDPGYALVLDSVLDENHPGFNRAVTQIWHGPEEFRILAPGRVRTAGKQGCLMLWLRPGSLRRLGTGCDFLEEETAELGASYNRYNLRVRRWMGLAHPGGVGFTTLIYPFTGPVPDVSIRAVPAEGGAPWRTEAVEVRGPRGMDRIILNPERMGGLKVESEPVETRAHIDLANSRGITTVE